MLPPQISQHSRSSDLGPLDYTKRHVAHEIDSSHCDTISANTNNSHKLESEREGKKCLEKYSPPKNVCVYIMLTFKIVRT
jgi:hypothetical protein